MAEPAVRVEEVSGLDALPAAALALFGGDAFCTTSWYRSVAEAALDPREYARFHLAWLGATLLAVVPMRHGPDGYAALTTPYTALWSPLLRDNLDATGIEALGRALGRVWRRWPCTRLDALDGDAAWLPPLLRGIRRSGLVPLHFDHFGNWRLDVTGWGWDRYLATRPGELRSAVARRTRRLVHGLSADFTLVDGTDGLESGIAAYERVYASSWKQAEPYPGFAATLMRYSASAGSLRLGLLSLGDEPVAAQLWLLHGKWAGVQKLAHDEAHHHLAPGTVLTALMVRHLLEREGAAIVDFGRGDDAYKRSWTGERRRRIGVVLAAPWRRAALLQLLRHGAGRLAKQSLVEKQD